MDALLKRPQLPLNGLAAINGKYGDLREIGKKVGELFCDLDGEFTCRAKHYSLDSLV